MQASEGELLARQALQIRVAVAQMIRMSGSGHLAGSLDLADVFAYFYHRVLRLRPEEPEWPERDLFFLSAGHVCPVWYATLAQCGFFPTEQLLTLRQFGSPLQGHPHRQPALGIENSAGPLGQGVSLAAGAAYALKQEASARQVFVVSSDGEQDEGQVWEAYLFAAHYHLDNLTVIIDVNGIQQSGTTAAVLDTHDLRAKLQAFNFLVAVADGHDFADLDDKYHQLAALSGKPKCLLCRTIPGKGIKLLEGDPRWHASQPSEVVWAEIFADLAAQLRAAGIETTGTQ